MQISAPTAAHARAAASGSTPPTAGQNGEILVRPGDERSVLDLSPAGRFVQLYANEIFGLQGSLAIGYLHPKYGDAVRIRFETAEHAYMADQALKDTVLGVKLLYVDRNGNPFDPAAPIADWARTRSNLLRNVAAMPGVVAWNWMGERAAMFVPWDTDRRVKLQQLVEPTIGGVRAYWKGECHGPGCPPDPAPPSAAR